MVEVIVALGVGLVLAFLLASPAVVRTSTTAARRDALVQPASGPPVSPTAASTSPAPDPAATRKATQTAHKFK